jgi:AcrR family transcriptional regulator
MPQGGGGSRVRILEAAKAEFARHGYAGARVASIARQAQVNKQLLYYYFGSKIGLHEAASNPAESAGVVGSLAREAGQTGVPERLRQAIDRVFRTLCDHPEVAALLVDRQGGHNAETAARGFVASVLRELTTVISEGQGMGYFGDTVVPASVAAKALVLCAGYLALEPILPTGSRSRSTWSGEVSALLLKAIAW